ncbi:MAG: DUF2062 domain-containing protein [Nitrospina sp.]|nr:DUF2062 domain-containing protein [Nitrospina sp.]
MMKAIKFNNKIFLSLSKLLKQGLSPVKLSLVIALGITLSVFPILGTTTLICTFIALLFHLNLPAIQLANYAAFPLQVILFFPFLKLGKIISQVSLAPISKTQLIATFEEGFFYAIQELSHYLIISCLGWLLASVPIFIILFFCLWAILKNYRPILVMSEGSHKTHQT